MTIPPVGGVQTTNWTNGRSGWKASPRLERLIGRWYPSGQLRNRQVTVLDAFGKNADCVVRVKALMVLNAHPKVFDSTVAP